MMHDRLRRRRCRTASLSAEGHRLLGATNTLDGSQSFGFRCSSSLRLNSLFESSQASRSEPESHSFCCDSQSAWYEPVSETRSTSKPACRKTLNGCRASVTKRPIGHLALCPFECVMGGFTSLFAVRIQRCMCRSDRDQSFAWWCHHECISATSGYVQYSYTRKHDNVLWYD